MSVTRSLGGDALLSASPPSSTFRPGQMVWSRGGNEFGDARTGGCVVQVVGDDNGEPCVVIVTTSQTTPRRPNLIVHHQDGRKRAAYEDIGTVAHLARLPVADLDLSAADDFRHYAKVMDHARLALFAAAVAMLPPFNRREHDALFTAYRVLRAEADLLQRGAK